MRTSCKSLSIALLFGSVALACSSSKSSSPTETTAAKVDPKDHAEALERLDRATAVVNAFAEKIPMNVARGARCVVAIPSMVKGGLIVGGESGKGYASCLTGQGWSAPAPVKISGGTLGAQVGVQSTDVLALVKTTKGAHGLLSGNFNIGVDASASAGPVGTGRGTSSDVNSDTDVVSYSRAKGLFAGAELNGSTLRLDEDTTKALYGSMPPMGDILGGRVKAPGDAAAQQFLAAVRASFGRP